VQALPVTKLTDKRQDLRHLPFPPFESFPHKTKVHLFNAAFRQVRPWTPKDEVAHPPFDHPDRTEPRACVQIDHSFCTFQDRRKTSLVSPFQDPFFLPAYLFDPPIEDFLDIVTRLPTGLPEKLIHVM
jgi:hypothetical protein